MIRQLFVAAICAIAVACAPAANTQSTGDAVTIRFATDWTAQAEHGGFYQALADGEYRRRGLDVRIIQGGPSVNVPQLLAVGSVEMGMGSNGFIVLNLAREGAPARAVATTMQKDPQVLMTHPDPAISSIADMKGRPILVSDASISGLWQWLKARFGFTDDQIRANPSPAVFARDKRAVMQGYVTSEPYIVRTEVGFEPEVYLLADAGYPGYAGMILATDAFIAAHPEAVRAFVEATAQGWRSYLNGDPTAGDALTRRDNPEKTPEQLAAAREELRARGLIESGDAAALGIGAMTDERWRTFFQMASDLGLYPADMDWRRAYTLEFLPSPPRP